MFVCYRKLSITSNKQVKYYNHFNNNFIATYFRAILFDYVNSFTQKRQIAQRAIFNENNSDGGYSLSINGLNGGYCY